MKKDIRLILGIVFAIVLLSVVSLMIKDTQRFEYNSPAVYIRGTLFTVEIADTPPVRQKGLSGRDLLSENSGMLFVFDKDARHSIWMKDMRFPIDILWLDEGGRVVDIKDNARPESYPEVFYPAYPARFVLEVPAGTAQKHSIKVGDEIQINK